MALPILLIDIFIFIYKIDLRWFETIILIALSIDLRSLGSKIKFLLPIKKLWQRLFCWNPRDEDYRIGVALLQELYRLDSIEEAAEA